MTDAVMDVLIVGAGAAGLTLGIELARRNVRFRLIDKLDGPFRGSRGKGIQPRTQEVFEDLGIIDRIVAAGGVYPPQRVYRGDGGVAESPVMEHQDATPGEPWHIPLMVPQFLTEAVMRDRLAALGHQPAFACELTAFEQDVDVVTAHLRSVHGEETVRARYLIGADGGRSLVRHALGIGFPGKTMGIRAIVADVTLHGLGRDAWHRFNEASMQTQLALCPLAGTGYFQLQAPVPVEGDVDLTAAGLNALISQRTGREDIVVESVSWASAYTMNARLADQYRARRVFLTGDAAHIHPPTGGQGLNTSVQDAYNLGWKLAAVLGGAPDALLDSYEAERRPVAAQVLGLASSLLDAARQGSMKRGRDVQQLDIGYRASWLVQPLPHRQSGIQPGDRAPDAPCVGAGGQPRRLFELFKGTHWTLLGIGAPQDLRQVPARAGLHIHAVGPHGDIVDQAGHIQAAYGVAAGDWVLVRPDGYVGAVASSAGIATLAAYLDMVGLRAEI